MIIGVCFMAPKFTAIAQKSGEIKKLADSSVPRKNMCQSQIDEIMQSLLRTICENMATHMGIKDHACVRCFELQEEHAL